MAAHPVNVRGRRDGGAQDMQVQGFAIKPFMKFNVAVGKGKRAALAVAIALDGREIHPLPGGRIRVKSEVPII